MKFSVIIPAMNEEERIGRCLASIFETDWNPAELEVVVVDNGSIDGTARLAAEMGAQVYVVPGVTVAALRNFGAARTTGAILAFIDADCTVDRSWLKRAEKYLASPGIVCFGSPPVVPPGATWVQRAWYEVRRKRVAVGETEWLESMNMFVRREAFEALGGFDESLVTCEDYDLCVRMRTQGKVFTDSDLVAVHYGEAETLRRFFRKEYWRGIGNLKGVLRHGVSLSELPSLCLPLVHCFILIALGVTAILKDSLPPSVVLPVAALFVGWQALLFFSSLAKYYRYALLHVPQIFVLLNVYYLARGLAILRQSS